VGVYWRYFVYIYASYNIIVLAVIKMQNVKNFIQGKALGVAEYWTPVLKVILHCLRVWVGHFGLPFDSVGCYWSSSTSTIRKHSTVGMPNE